MLNTFLLILRHQLILFLLIHRFFSLQTLQLTLQFLNLRHHRKAFCLMVQFSFLLHLQPLNNLSIIRIFLFPSLINFKRPPTPLLPQRLYLLPILRLNFFNFLRVPPPYLIQNCFMSPNLPNNLLISRLQIRYLTI